MMAFEDAVVPKQGIDSGDLYTLSVLKKHNPKILLDHYRATILSSTSWRICFGDQ